MRCFIAVLLLWAGCGSPCQQVKATRCNLQVVEVCGSNQKWQRTLDCAQVKPITPNAPKEWMCGQIPTGHTCIPKK
jgi:hypothetical protein